MIDVLCSVGCYMKSSHELANRDSLQYTGTEPTESVDSCAHTRTVA